MGGVSRGGASTGLLWGEESGVDRGRFEAKLLPLGRFVDLDSSAAIGLLTDVPEVAPTGEGAGLVEVEGSEGKAAWRRRLSPQHRDAVRQFFSGPDRKE
jgi:hypothetical protein